MELNNAGAPPSYLRFGRHAATALSVACYALILAQAGAGWWRVVFDQGFAAGIPVGAVGDSMYAAGFSVFVYMMIFRWNPGEQAIRRLIELCFILMISLGIATRTDNLLGLDISTAWRTGSVVGVACLLVIMFGLIWPSSAKTNARKD